MQQVFILGVLAEVWWKYLIDAGLEGFKGSPPGVILILLDFAALNLLVPYFNGLRNDPTYGFDFFSRIPLYALGLLIFVLLGWAVTLLYFMIKQL